MLKKMMLLAVSVAALAAFAIPASASAASTHWTDNDVVVENGVNITAPFEGKIQFTAGKSTFSCEVTTKILVVGPTTALVTSFAPTTSSCIGTVAFENCTLKAHSNNAPWTIVNNDANLTILKPESKITIKYEFDGTGCLVPSLHLEFSNITATPTLNANGTITSIAISGTSTTGVVASGSVAPEGTPTLGLVTVP